MKFASILDEEPISDDDDNDDLHEFGENESTSEHNSNRSTPAQQDEEIEDEDDEENGTDRLIKSETEETASKPRRKRLEPAPRIPENAPEISVLVMFRSRFTELYNGVPDMGPQDFEEGIIEELPSAEVDAFLSRTLGLALNRKKAIEPGLYGRALEEANSQYGASYWGVLKGSSGPLAGGKSFKRLGWEDRLQILVAVVYWALASSEAVRKVLLSNYSIQRCNGDKNCALAVLPLGMDGERKRYYLIEGLNDTRFRLYCETNPRKKIVNWTAVASSVEELKQLEQNLRETDNSRNAKILCERLSKQLARLEQGVIKRRRRDVQSQRKMEAEESVALAHKRDGGIYHGRTRGKKVNYGPSEEEDLIFRDLDEHQGTSASNSPAPKTVYKTASGRTSRRPVSTVFSSIDPDEINEYMIEATDGANGGMREHSPIIHEDNGKGREKGGDSSKSEDLEDENHDHDADDEDNDSTFMENDHDADPDDEADELVHMNIDQRELEAVGAKQEQSGEVKGDETDQKDVVNEGEPVPPSLSQATEQVQIQQMQVLNQPEQAPGQVQALKD
ncbi:hypothetical protein V1511DRAFT_457684 [Dipodascopsis uninucleata]